ncbi:MAG: Gfo/Idh/MocA family oxidoreductase [Planctomycetia bacterium]|nr:Gfo/Idh/MocA family oxidoreductase [Planctomycetia bacterium]
MSRAVNYAKSIARRLLGRGRELREQYALARSKLAVDARLSGAAGTVALIGSGVQGRTIARAIKLLPGWRLATIFDLKREAADRMRADLWPAADVPSGDEAFWKAAAAADVVAIATTAPSHFALATKAIESGAKAVLLEKPITNRLADADHLIEAAAKRGCRMAVDHTRRYMPSSEGLKRLVSRGIVGRPRSASYLYGCAGFAMIGTHLFDLARWLFDSEIVRVRAELDDEVHPFDRGPQFVDHAGRCEARLANGVRLSLDLSGNLHTKHQLLVVACDRGRFEVDEQRGSIRLVGTGIHTWDSDYLASANLELSVARALLELGQGKAPRCGLADGRAALEAAIACQVSAREGSGWVDLPLIDGLREEAFPFA